MRAERLYNLPFRDWTKCSLAHDVAYGAYGSCLDFVYVYVYGLPNREIATLALARPIACPLGHNGVRWVVVRFLPWM